MGSPPPPTYDVWQPGASEYPDRPERRSAVNDPLTMRRPRPVVENDDYAGFVRRVVRAHGRRIAAGDVEALADLLAVATEVEQATQTAVDGLRATGYSWAEIAARIDVTRQAAQQRWGARAVNNGG